MSTAITNIFIVLISITLSVYAKKLPDIFFGTYSLERTINLNEYLIAKALFALLTDLVLLFKRRQCSQKSQTIVEGTIIMATHVTKIIHKAESGLPLRYDMDTLTWKKNIRYRDVALGEEFESQHLEDGLFKVKFDYNNGTLTESLIGIDCSPPYNETFRYTREDDYLVVRTEWGGVKAEGYYKKHGV